MISYSENDIERGRDAMREMSCPECHSNEIERKHAEFTIALPKIDYKECYECGATWDHQ